MTTVACTNEECPEYQILKVGADKFVVDDIICGHCGGPVEEVEEPADA